ncbi:hypothetical protein SLEP1_g39016 [Rubroshorea leprosula]|uniref:Uncharacterized protein n=1 Tax=Rubroshorea leprosula TaxID=152421 RepID=A0AAV5KZB9_9ROSI|nr:hypothetical protein SLEP1_g39016 [Rubroshorea leprosula]
MPDAFCVIVVRKNTASESIKQKLVFAGSEEGKLLALHQSFLELYCFYGHCLPCNICKWKTCSHNNNRPQSGLEQR